MGSKKFDPEKLAKLNDPERKKIQDPELIWKTLDLKDPKILVEIGAGTGFFAFPFSEKLNKGRVYACDLSDFMVGWMNENLPQKCRGIVIPVKMDESKVPLTDGIADLVYMINLHHELDEPVQVIREAYRLLKRAGTLMIIDWKKEETPEGPPLSIRVTADTIRSQMIEGGFPNVEQNNLLPYHSFSIGRKG